MTKRTWSLCDYPFRRLSSDERAYEEHLNAAYVSQPVFSYIFTPLRTYTVVPCFRDDKRSVQVNYVIIRCCRFSFIVVLLEVTVGLNGLALIQQHVSKGCTDRHILTAIHKLNRLFTITLDTVSVFV